MVEYMIYEHLENTLINSIYLLPLGLSFTFILF